MPKFKVTYTKLHETEVEAATVLQAKSQVFGYENGNTIVHVEEVESVRRYHVEFKVEAQGKVGVNARSADEARETAKAMPALQPVPVKITAVYDVGPAEPEMALRDYTEEVKKASPQELTHVWERRNEEGESLSLHRTKEGAAKMWRDRWGGSPVRFIATNGDVYVSGKRIGSTRIRPLEK
jgi:hypothetical protein